MTGKENNKPYGKTVIMEILLVEPAIVPDVFCSGLAEVEDLGDGNFRFTLYSKQKSYSSSDRHDEYVIVARHIMTQTAILQAMEMTMKAMGIACCGAERLKARH